MRLIRRSVDWSGVKCKIFCIFSSRLRLHSIVTKYLGLSTPPCHLPQLHDILLGGLDDGGGLVLPAP